MMFLGPDRLLVLAPLGATKGLLTAVELFRRIFGHAAASAAARDDRMVEGDVHLQNLNCFMFSTVWWLLGGLFGWRFISFFMSHRRHLIVPGMKSNAGWKPSMNDTVGNCFLIS